MALADFNFDLLSENFDLDSFDSTDADIDEFLKQDALNYQEEMMAKTYLFYKDRSTIIAFFSILNDCLQDKGYSNNVWNKFHRKQSIPNRKRIRQYPAIKIGRLGVAKDFQGTGVAYELMDFIKGFSILELKPACRLLLLDAYNKPQQLRYYKSNGFTFLFEDPENAKTRLMYYDLIELS